MQQAEPPPHPAPVHGRSDDTLVVGLVPLLEPYFRTGAVRDLMPAPLRDAMDTHGLTARHGAVLPQLLAAGPLSVGEIAKRLHVSLPTASELVGGLHRAGVVERAEDPANRRRVLVSLAEAYREPLETFVVRRGGPLLRALATLGPAERAGFVAGLTAWVHEVQST
ncbi:MarR family winged helix-turn-helix transcriptional regulator [Streptomyces huiliensis]|uniref:MarR family winged helix-turn-helix transcriptional regulator n=1 Tax=Streptomyces huiliensis TaxID=2876027 RepID=UPI001CBFD73C|nr:MarR family transcriptional regulator [Streptomyces huiliensis]MBZ4321250.1 MarR family transcriptional regulator [Streptomyces huiliensis]